MAMAKVARNERLLWSVMIRGNSLISLESDDCLWFHLIKQHCIASTLRRSIKTIYWEGRREKDSKKQWIAHSLKSHMRSSMSALIERNTDQLHFRETPCHSWGHPLSLNSKFRSWKKSWSIKEKWESWQSINSKEKPPKKLSESEIIHRVNKDY